MQIQNENCGHHNNSKLLKKIGVGGQFKKKQSLVYRLNNLSDKAFRGGLKLGSGLNLKLLQYNYTLAF